MGQQPGDGDAGQQGHQHHHHHRAGGVVDDFVADPAGDLRLPLVKLDERRQASRQALVTLAPLAANQRIGAFRIVAPGQLQQGLVAGQVVAGGVEDFLEQLLLLR
ncbi:hypothetical protein D3C80_1766770 [compost metagenome]